LLLAFFLGIIRSAEIFCRLFELMACSLDGIPSLRSVSSVVSLAISPKKTFGKKFLMPRSQRPKKFYGVFCEKCYCCS